MVCEFWSGWTRAIRAVPVIYALYLAPIALKPDNQTASKGPTAPLLETQNFTRQKRFEFRDPQKLYRYPLVDLQEFEEIELSGRPFFTRELFDKVVKLQGSASLSEGSRLFWVRSYFMVAKDGIGGFSIDDVPGVRVRAPSNYGRTAPLRAEQLQEEVQQLQKQREQSQMCLDLQKLPQDCAHRMPRIDNIICFGLGAHHVPKDRNTQHLSTRTK
jgi:hypothetical protein